MKNVKAQTKRHWVTKPIKPLMKSSSFAQACLSMPLSVSDAKAKLGTLLDIAGSGEQVLLRRKDRLFRIEVVEQITPIPLRPVGYFSDDGEDPANALINDAPVSFDPQP